MQVHHMQTIAESGSKPMQKTPIMLESRDDRMAGSILAAEVLAFAKGNVNTWRAFAIRIIDMTVESRSVFIKAIKAQNADMTKQSTEFGFTGKGFAKGNTKSFGVEVSKLTTIANAFNSGASVAGWMEYVNRQIDDKSKHAKDDAEMLEHGGYETLVSYARTFSESKAGRKADDWITKFGKFLERTKPEDTDTKGVEFYEQAVKMYNGMVK